MGFIDEIKSAFDLEPFAKEPCYKAVIFGDSACYFEGVKSIKYYSEDTVSLVLKKGAITVKGVELSIKKFCEGDVVVCGKISEIKRD